MSLLSIGLASEIRSARKALAASAPGSAADLAAALNFAEDCLADLERAETLLAQETASADRARAALDRALIAADRERIAAEIAAAPDSPAEAKRRRAANLRRIAALKKGGLL